MILRDASMPKNRSDRRLHRWTQSGNGAVLTEPIDNLAQATMANHLQTLTDVQLESALRAATNVLDIWSRMTFEHRRQTVKAQP
jgi:hypothetical protein